MTTSWKHIDVPMYELAFEVPGDWEVLPPQPSTISPEILRVTGGPGLRVIMHKFPSVGRGTAMQIAETQKSLAQNKGKVSSPNVTPLPFAGVDGAMLEFETRDGTSTPSLTRQYFAVRGHAVFVLGICSTQWEQHRDVSEQIAQSVRVAP